MESRNINNNQKVKHNGDDDDKNDGSLILDICLNNVSLIYLSVKLQVEIHYGVDYVLILNNLLVLLPYLVCLEYLLTVFINLIPYQHPSFSLFIIGTRTWTLMAMREEVPYTIFLDLHRAYDALDRSR